MRQIEVLEGPQGPRHSAQIEMTDFGIMLDIGHRAIDSAMPRALLQSCSMHCYNFTEYRMHFKKNHTVHACHRCGAPRRAARGGTPRDSSSRSRHRVQVIWQCNLVNNNNNLAIARMNQLSLPISLMTPSHSETISTILVSISQRSPNGPCIVCVTCQVSIPVAKCAGSFGTCWYTSTDALSVNQRP